MSSGCHAQGHLAVIHHCSKKNPLSLVATFHCDCFAAAGGGLHALQGVVRHGRITAERLDVGDCGSNPPHTRVLWRESSHQDPPRETGDYCSLSAKACQGNCQCSTRSSHSVTGNLWILHQKTADILLFGPGYMINLGGNSSELGHHKALLSVFCQVNNRRNSSHKTVCPASSSR